MKKHRIILKLSGEALAAPEGGYNEPEVRRIALEVKKAVTSGSEVGIVIGGGNYWRGRTSKNIDRTKADSIGMLATVMNCLYVSEIFRSEGMKTQIFTPFIVGNMTELFSKDKANERFAQGYVLFFGGGTGHPYVSTDTGIALRAIEMEADMVLLAKNIDGVYDSDPAVNPNAKRYDTITMDEMVEKKLKVIDVTASALCLENKMPLAVFDLKAEGALAAALKGEIHGTTITV